MKILLIGSGGREHAMALALAGDGVELVASPGNPGIAGFARLVPGTSIDEWLAIAANEKVDLVVVGPEAPLVDGLADRLEELAIPCCGPKARAAALEGSKSHTRTLGLRVGLPQPSFVVVRGLEEMNDALKRFSTAPVVKADGLAAGKGVVVPESWEECRAGAEALLDGSLGQAGRCVVLEERLEGTEASLFYACSGTSFVALPDAQDHKRLHDGQTGPNTGGMGAVSPNPDLSAELRGRVAREIVAPTLAELERCGTPFCGFLYVGVMLTNSGPQLVEFNVRLGDPEAQAILPRLAPGQFAELCARTASGKLSGFTPAVDPRATCAIVVSAAGYPTAPRKGDRVSIAKALQTDDRWLVHAGTRLVDDQLETSGGRVAAIVARGDDRIAARKLAYAGLEHLRFEGMHYRNDIGGTP